ncbi:hypothetical protein BAUCODRAFT_389389 [Baudoinia panamericana UAMH 10762]|uniref:Muconate cycloisomerase 1 n=1 Tax=Baudoinia panamericana (strain UAMH 10762) TaxID=717646 RepID=M2MQJ0_BAUPA|nr:uncharacterized protein BAUCODRAFT_389389 [Baudoinia panamericana UAMH 10762]EMC99056.1 hypothetical protein BAUCODRAFT_389389 [Baudoinia panamericana UAMH 10762]
MDFIVGSFNHDLYTLHFERSTHKLSILRQTPAIGGHSWLSLSAKKDFLYCTAWTKPRPSIAAYRIDRSGREIHFLNAKHINALSGYVCCSATHVYSVGGPTGEAFRIAADGSIGELVQELSFIEPEGVNVSEQRGAVPHGDFGGLRHGAHSVDLSPDGRSLYVADIGRNCIWTFSIDPSTASGRGIMEPPLKLAMKHMSPRPHDGPRHTWPHPNGRVLYSLQEHTSIVDLFAVHEDGVTLQHITGVKIIPTDRDPKDYWADEVRLSAGPEKRQPIYMYASTRGLTASTKGYVAVFKLRTDGTLDSEQAICIWETPTSGGIANAIEPAPWQAGQREGEMEYLAMTDSEEGWVFMLGFDGKEIKEVSRLNLGKTDDGAVVKAATAVWL